MSRLGDARIPYDRTYWRINQNSPLSEYLAIAQEVYQTRGTIGFSNDDAGVGVGLNHKQVIEVGGEYDQQEMDEWYESNYGVTDVIYLNTLNDFDFTHWVASSTRITQYFGENPEYYAQFGLPGHEGLDMEAPLNSPIMACAIGEVYYVGTQRPNGQPSNYGLHIRIRHQARDGVFKTIYAHLQEALVSIGDWVTGGQVIGLADSTGNSWGHHLHLTLKKEGATDSGETDYPGDIIDPTPYALPFIDTPPITSQPAMGLHLRADPNAPLSGEWGEVETLAASDEIPKIIKLLHAHPQSAFIDAATKLGTEALYVIRIFQSWGNRQISPSEFVQWNAQELIAKLAHLRQYGIQSSSTWIEVHNEPNLMEEGWTQSWANGFEFAQWLDEVIGLLKNYDDLTTCKYLFPGLSPGGTVSGIRYDSSTFIDECIAYWNQYTNQCDGIGLHGYWSNAFPMDYTLSQIDQVQVKFPGHTEYIITEASRNDRPMANVNYGQEYAQFSRSLSNRPGILGITFFVGSASNLYFEPEVWVRENGSRKGIADEIVNNT